MIPNFFLEFYSKGSFYWFLTTNIILRFFPGFCGGRWVWDRPLHPELRSVSLPQGRGGAAAEEGAGDPLGPLRKGCQRGGEKGWGPLPVGGIC